MPPDNNQIAQRSVRGNQIPPIGRLSTDSLQAGTPETGYAFRGATNRTTYRLPKSQIRVVVIFKRNTEHIHVLTSTEMASLASSSPPENSNSPSRLLPESRSHFPSSPKFRFRNPMTSQATRMRQT